MRNVQVIEVDGQQYADLSRFVVRWVSADGGDQPVLYQNGKRVTKPWALLLSIQMEADEHGGNANTA